MANDKEQNPGKGEPTRSEWEILNVLWQHGPSTVRFVNEVLNAEQRPVQYTSTLKLMQIMVEKGLLRRDKSQMKHVYRPAVEEDKTKGQLLDRMLDSLFDGSVSRLVLQLLGDKKPSPKELQAIRDLIDRMDRDKPSSQ
jgi:predicted transcriptional regulator